MAADAQAPRPPAPRFDADLLVETTSARLREAGLDPLTEAEEAEARARVARLQAPPTREELVWAAYSEWLRESLRGVSPDWRCPA